MKRSLMLAALALAGCASTQTASYVGKTIEQAQATYGQPTHVTDLADGRRAYQYRPASVRDSIPDRATSDSKHGSVSTFANNGSSDCLITMVAADHGQGYVVEETKMPRQGACT